MQEAGRDTGQLMCAQLARVPPTAFHQELELFMKSPVTSLEKEHFLPMAAAEPPGCTQPPHPALPGPLWAAPARARGCPDLQGTSHTLGRSNFLPFGEERDGKGEINLSETS